MQPPEQFKPPPTTDLRAGGGSLGSAFRPQISTRASCVCVYTQKHIFTTAAVLLRWILPFFDSSHVHGIPAHQNMTPPSWPHTHTRTHARTHTHPQVMTISAAQPALQQVLVLCSSQFPPPPSSDTHSVYHFPFFSPQFPLVVQPVRVNSNPKPQDLGSTTTHPFSLPIFPFGPRANTKKQTL